jgi:hypothetical protein
MHSATQSSLSKITQGQKILVVELADGRFEYGRPKDPTAVFRSVTAIFTTRDTWSSKTYTVKVTGNRLNEGRYGTTHVYVPVEAEAEAEAPEPVEVGVQEYEVEKPGAEVEFDSESGPKRVRVESDGTIRVKDWSGGHVIERTPHGRVIRIAEDGVVTVIEADGTERPGIVETPKPRRRVQLTDEGKVEIVEDEPTDDELDEANAGDPDPGVIASEKCLQCKGYGVVRKRGSQAGKAYRTLNGSEAAKANGNAADCPVCDATGLVGRAA